MMKRNLIRSIALILSALSTLHIYAEPAFETNISYQGQVGDKYEWQLYVKNASAGTDDNDSGVSMRVNAEMTSDHGYSGGTIGDFWQTDAITDNYFDSSIWNGLGAIDPIALDPMADELWINFLTDYGTLVNSTVEIDTYGGDTVIVDQQLPGVLTADIYDDNEVNFKDFALLASQWQMPYESNIPTNGSVDNGEVQYDFNFDMNLGEATIAISNIGTTPLTEFNLNIAELVGYEADPDVWGLNPSSGTANFSITGGTLENGSGFLIDYTFNKDLVELTFDSLDYSGAFGSGTLDNIVTIKEIPELSADITGDSVVDINDLDELCQQWLMTETWYGP